MSEEVPENPLELTEEYLNLQNGENDTDVDEVEKKRDYWEDQIDVFKQNTPMHEMAVEERDKFQTKLDDVSNQREQRSRLRSELLSLVSTGFAPQGDWMNKTVVSAVTHALVGKRYGQILIGDYAIPKDTDDLSKRNIVTIAKTVQTVAAHAAGSNEAIRDVWDKMSTDTVLPITRTIARSESPLTAGEISKKVNDEGPDSPGANLRYYINSSEYHPYYRENGKWSFSLLGEYAWKEFGPECTEKNKSNEENQQFSFDDIKNAEVTQKE